MHLRNSEVFVFLIVVAGLVPPFWKIFQKTGYPGALSLLMLVPLANIFMLFFLAFTNWPIERELHNYRRVKD
ncbi:MAG: hypothetical protein M1299_01190 [Firmicutes bacterium]|nr:hypothetical protein [Bacillota bacterium]MCL5038439.1 hypothetical protein [Bacillota bacterium]